MYIPRYPKGTRYPGPGYLILSLIIRWEAFLPYY